MRIGQILQARGRLSAAQIGLVLEEQSRLTRRFGERRLALCAVILFMSGNIAVAVASSLVPLLLACTLLALGSSLFTPTVTSLVSQEAAAGERGAVLGAYQSATALGRVAGPAFSGALFAAGPSLAYLAAALLAAPALWFLTAAPKAEPKATGAP